MTRSFVGALAVLAAVVMVAAGCGSDSDTSGNDSSTLTKAEFLKQGNAVCAKGNEEIEAGFEEFSEEHNLSEKKQPSQAQLEEAIESILIPGIRKQIDGLEALGAPSGEEAEVEAILSAAEEALEKGEEDPSVLAGETNGPFIKANKLAREYGLAKCGEEDAEG